MYLDQKAQGFILGHKKMCDPIVTVENFCNIVVIKNKF